MTLLHCTTRVILFLILAASLLGAADFSAYRGFRFGAKLEVVARQAEAKPSDVKLVHQRRAVIQELEWRPHTPYLSDAKRVDPVKDSLLRFYHGQLFQIVTTYRRDMDTGMTEADMVEAILLTYGTATNPAVEIPFHSSDGEVTAVLARLENAEYAYSLVRTGDGTSFALILNCKRLNKLAQAAVAEATRLDAPKRAIELRKGTMQKTASRLPRPGPRTCQTSVLEQS